MLLILFVNYRVRIVEEKLTIELNLVIGGIFKMNKIDKIMIYVFAILLIGILGFIGYELGEIVKKLDVIQYNIFHS
jgi:hypothetical protein